MKVMNCLICLFTGFILFGCQPSRESRESSYLSANGVVVNIKGGGEFPKLLAGKWVSEGYKWEIVFTEDGTIDYVVMSLGDFKVEPGKVNHIPMKDGGESVLTPGQWFVNYDPEERYLEVEVSLSEFNAEIGKGVLVGSIKDIFIGKVSPDFTGWQTQWYNLPEYAVKLADDKEPQELSTDDLENPRAEVTFKKVLSED